MLEKVKAYFNIPSTDVSHDAVIEDIISSASSLIEELGSAESLIYYMVIEDVSLYLQSGQKAFETAQVSQGIHRYSDLLYHSITHTIKERVF